MSKGNDFYENKGMVRYTMIISQEGKEKLNQVASDYGLSQADIIDVIVSNMNRIEMDKHFVAKRESKVDGRKTRHEKQKQVVESVAGLTPEQLAVVNATIANLKQS